jgi:uncharacterized protein (DUF2141 family)
MVTRSAKVTMMFHRLFRGSAVLLLIGLCCGGNLQAADAAKKGDLVVSVLKIGSEQGTVRWALYGSEESFSDAVHHEGPATPVRFGTCAPKESGTQFTIPALEHGDYALLLYHDENMNDKVDKRALGLPKERVGVSNYTSRPLRKPYWSKAKFAHNGSPTQLTIQTFR